MNTLIFLIERFGTKDAALEAAIALYDFCEEHGHACGIEVIAGGFILFTSMEVGNE